MTYADYEKRSQRIVSSERRFPKIVYPRGEDGREKTHVDDFDWNVAYSLMSQAVAKTQGKPFLETEDPLAKKLMSEVLPLLVSRLEIEEDFIQEKKFYEVIRGALKDSGLDLLISWNFAKLAGISFGRTLL